MQQHRSQSELISAMLLIAVTLAIALAAYGYFISRAASEAKLQNIEAMLASLKAKIVISLDFHYTDPSTNNELYYVSLRNIEDNVYTFFFAVVGAEFSGEFINILDTGNIQVYLMKPSNGIYIEQPLEAPYQVPPENLYIEPYNSIASTTDVSIKIYEVNATALPGEMGCEVLLKIEVPASLQGKPIIFIVTPIDNVFFIVDKSIFAGGQQ